MNKTTSSCWEVHSKTDNMGIINRKKRQHRMGLVCIYVSINLIPVESHITFLGFFRSALRHHRVGGEPQRCWIPVRK